MKWLDGEWRPAGKVVGPSDYICRKLVARGLVERRHFLRPEYRLNAAGVAVKATV